jgi:hypothetical protein
LVGRYDIITDHQRSLIATTRSSYHLPCYYYYLLLLAVVSSLALIRKQSNQSLLLLLRLLNRQRNTLQLQFFHVNRSYREYPSMIQSTAPLMSPLCLRNASSAVLRSIAIISTNWKMEASEMSTGNVA